MERSKPAAYCIDVPVDMLQQTEKNGEVMPVAFEWEDEYGDISVVEIKEVVYMQPMAEQKTGCHGDRYECVIEVGEVRRTEYLWYSARRPRYWFKMKEVSREEYEAHYRLPGEAP